jgi:S1-C subfamily serine protease
LRGERSAYNLGSIFEDVSQRDKQALDINSGVRVKDVGQGRLRALGIRNGFVITAVNDKPVNSASDIQSIVDAVESKGRILFNCVSPRGQIVYYVDVK